MHLFLAQTAGSGRLGPELWEGLGHDWRALVWLGLLQVAIVAAAWAAGRVLVPRREMNSFGQFERREGGGLGRALLLYLGYVLLAVALVLALRWIGPAGRHAVITLFSYPAQLGAKWIAILALAAVVLLVLKLALPMLIYRVRLPRTLVLLALIAVLAGGAGWLLDLALGHPAAKRVPVVRQWLLRHGGRRGLAETPASRAAANERFTDAERTSSDPSKPIAERKEAVRTLYRELDEIRARLPENDAAALADYNAKKARYEALIQELRAVIAAHPELAE